MRVGIDGRAFASPSAGVRRYVHSLVPALLALGEPLELVALGGRDTPAGLEHVAEPLHLPTNLGWALTGLPRAARRAGVDVIHAPAYTGPLSARVPVALTIHDVSYERRPEYYPYRRDRWRREFYRRSARAAAHILTDSRFSADEIVAAYGIDAARITVAPLGVDPAFAPLQPRQVPLETGPPFLLHVGDLHERRNLPMVIEALAQVRRRTGIDLRLVLAGVDRGVGHALEAAAAALGIQPAVGLRGSVDERDLVGLYRTAVALVYPSRYEGFGLPVLEAMAAGTPVIAARAGSIPEVLGDAGILLDPDDTTGWANAIAGVVRDHSLQQRMREQGRRRANEFTWERTARMTYAVYQAIAR